MRYEHLAPGRRTDRGWSVSSTYYLPERLGTAPRTTPLPPVDAAVVARVLEAARSVAPPSAAADLDALGPVVTAAARRPAPPVAGDARIRLLARPPLVHVTGRGAILTVGVTNLGTATWDPSADPAHQVGARFLDERGLPLGWELRAAFPATVAPGEEGLVRLEVPPTLPEGAKQLSVGLVQDGVAWHDAAATIDLAVELGRRVLVSTGVSTFPHLGDDLITQEVLAGLARDLPDVVPVLLAHPTDGLAERFGCEVATSPMAQATPSRRVTDPNRRVRDLVVQARLMAMGKEPDDPAVAAVLEPFARACAYVAAPGGGLASRYAEEALLPTAAEALIARAFGLPVFLEGPSVGPIEVRRDHAALAQLLNDATRISVRDPSSADAARRIGRAVDPAVVPDPATAAVAAADGPARAAARAWLDAHNIPVDRPYAVFSLRGGTADAGHVATVRRAAEALPLHTALVYLPHCTDPGGAHDDLALWRADGWAGPHLVGVEEDLGPMGAVALVAGARLAVGTRFHLSVLAAAAGVPAVALVGDEYDRLRLRGLRRWPGLRIVERDDPEGAARAAADLLAAPAPEPVPAWDAADLTKALGAVLPPAPRLA
jgi:polysaccharide pyruvyl transferase WcaK-like protein